MQETTEDMQRLEKLLEDSYASAGSHLLSIHTPNWRMSAKEICDELQGVVILSLATVNSKGEPLLGPVDGIFYRGRFWFGSSPDSIRAKHIKRRPQVSVGPIRGEEMAVIAHGAAQKLTDKESEMAQGFRSCAIEIYDEEMIDHHWHSAVYWSLDARKMFAVAPRIETGTHPPTA